MSEFDELQKSFDLCIAKKPGERSVSVAYSKNGSHYIAGSIASDTNLLNISSEHATIAIATLNRDYGINKIVSISELPHNNAVSPAILKIMTDYCIRTSNSIAYKILDINGAIIFETDDIFKNIPFYNPDKIELSRVKDIKPSKNMVETAFDDPLKLKDWAIKGLERNFPLYDSASGYGTALVTKSGRIYFGGQYSSPDKRLGLHSEITTIISALMDGSKEITHIGIVSSKYLDTPCDMCGICRQFIFEICSKLGINPILYAFAKETPAYNTYSITDYLPSAWTSKKWTK